MRWLLRPALVAISAVLMLAGAVVVFQGRPARSRLPMALPVGAGEHEVAWLYGATNATAWERFVEAVGRTAERLRGDHPDLIAAIGPEAFPRHTDSVPEVALKWSGGRLVFRWYKLTSDWKTRDWVKALLERPRPPLAIIGGSSSDTARELAIQLQNFADQLPDSGRPILVLTTATANTVQEERSSAEIAPGPSDLGSSADETEGIRLDQLYPGRTFRFCFTNRQMAVALTHFLWSRDDLRPDADPVHLVRWEDDSYSRDLIDGFWQALRRLLAEESVGELAWVTGCVANAAPVPALAGGVLPLARVGPRGSGFRMSRLPTPQFIDSSVGTFHMPNRFEAEAARYLLLDLEREVAPRRPLLVVTGQSAPTRRFLRALVRSAPIQARRFVVATGDALAFNLVYRDRRVTWPVLDLPFDLVLFCHHNPIDRAAGFRPDLDDRIQPLEEGLPAATGTEDLLLFGEIVEALTMAICKDAQPPVDAAAFGERLRALRVTQDRLGFDTGAPLFAPNGNRRGGTGEHIVCLRPHFEAERVLARATIEVWTCRSGPEGGRAWHRVGEPLAVAYDEVPAEGSDR